MKSPNPCHVGIGYRHEVHESIVSHLEYFDAFEITVDHYLHGGPRVRACIDTLANQKPLFAHGVGLSLGTAAPPDMHYVERVADTLDKLHARYYSEHLAFTGVAGMEIGNLLPLPRTRESIDRVVANIAAVRSVVSGPMLLEHISYYFEWPQAEMDEAAFLSQVCRESGCEILLDLENVCVNARNHGFEPMAFLRALPAEMVRAVHLAGGEMHDDTLVDTHAQPVDAQALALLPWVAAHFAPEVVIIERDRRLNAFHEVLDDMHKVRDTLEHEAQPPA